MVAMVLWSMEVLRVTSVSAFMGFSIHSLVRCCPSTISANYILYDPRESYFPDVRTQAMFQLLDTGFVGLIFSCFSEDAQKV